jgi:DNA gyrase/topoisomerase IV subunit B
MSKQQDYVALDSITAVRTNPGMFIGDTETPNHLATEVIDNMLDEVVNKYASVGEIFVDDQDGFWVTDNGRGLKLGTTKDPDTGEMKDSIELLCTKLFSGSKFRQNDLVDYKIQIGMHGVGLVVVNAFSEWLVIRIRKENKINEYVFIDSKLDKQRTFDVTDEKFSTQIGFKPDKKYFSDVSFDVKNIVNRLLLSQSVHEHAQFYINETEIPKISLYEFVRNTLSLDSKIDLHWIDQKFKNEEHLRIYLTYVDAKDSIVIGDVNLRTCDGTYLTNITTMIKDIIANNIERRFKALDPKEFLTGLRCYVNLTLEKPKFDAQVKSRMKTNIRSYLQIVEKRLIKILTDPEIMNILTNLLEAKVTKKLISTSNGRRISNKNKLRDCSQSPGDVLYIVEGDSADGTLKVVRHKATEASFPLRGKMLNVEKGSALKIENNEEIKQLLEALGPQGKRRYKKVKLLSDADSICGETPIFYKNIKGFLKWNKIKNISIDDIFEILSLNKKGEFEWKKVLNIIKHRYTKNEIYQIKLFHNHVLNCTNDHVIYIYNVLNKVISQKKPDEIDIKNDFMIIPKSLPTYQFDKEIDILDTIINNLSNNTNYKIYLKWEDFENDVDDKFVRVDISERVKRNLSIYDLSRNIKINQQTLTAYIGKCTTKAPLKVVKDINKFAKVNLKNAEITIQLNDQTKHYVEKGFFGNWNRKIQTKITISNQLAFLIGAYIGDGFHGSSKNNPYEVCFCAGNDQTFIDLIIEACDFCGFNNIVFDESNIYDNTTIRVKSIELKSILDYFGLNRQIKHDKKFVPFQFFNYDENIRLSLLMGIYYSDGCFFNTGNNRCRLSHQSSSKDLQIDINYLLNQFGVNPSLNYHKGKESGLNQLGKRIKGNKSIYGVLINRFDDLCKIKDICNFMDSDLSENHILTRKVPKNPIKILENFSIIPFKSIEKKIYKEECVYDLEIEDNNNFICGSANTIIHNSDGLHINLLATLFMSKFAPDMIKNSQVSIILPPLYGAIKGKTFIPLYNIEETEKYRSSYEIKRFKGLGEMNPDQLEVVIRNGREYIIKYPEKMDMVNLIVNDTEIRKKLMETNVSLKDLK